MSSKLSNRISQNKVEKSGKMAQGLKCLPQRHEDESLDLQKPCKSEVHMEALLKFQPQNVETKDPQNKVSSGFD